MKKMLKKQAGIFIMLLLVLTVLPCVKVSAGGGDVLKNKFKLTLTTSKVDKSGWEYLVDGLYSTTTRKLSKFKVTSSNKSVATVKALDSTTGAFVIKAKKTGTTKITLTGVVNNKKVKKTGTVKVVKYANPFKTLKLNGKSYNAKIKNSFNVLNINKNAASYKLNYKLKSGWKIMKKRSNVYCSVEDDFKSYSVKNGGVYPVGESMTTICITLQNTKTKAIVTTVFYIQ